jgi:hypothetical protein
MMRNSESEVMPYEESAWRSLHDLVGSVLEAAAAGAKSHDGAFREREREKVEARR